LSAAEPTADAKKAEMMKAWQEASTPGEEHDMLQSVVGKWKVTTQSWESEAAKPAESTGTSTFKSKLGGRFFEQEFKGKMNGMNYEGEGMMGYNKVTKKYESSWYDSMSTGMMTFTGDFDSGTKTFKESGEFSCPLKKEVQKMRSEFKIVDKNTMTFALYMPDMMSGKEYKAMEQSYKRIK
ncbi:MAG: DUF1579 domain-containing protein, partial [Proteobacteria bacterium]